MSVSSQLRISWISTPEIVTFSRPEIPLNIVESLARLKFEIWPEYIPSFESQLEKLLNSQQEYDPDLVSIHYFILDSDESVVAHSNSFRRVMRTTQEEIEVMALSGVCVRPDMRGNDLGAKVVKEAFKRVIDHTFSVSIYQTSVVNFYEKLGAKVCVDNTWIDSKNESNPTAHPWQAGETVMRYGPSFDWPKGEIDTNGGKY